MDEGENLDSTIKGYLVVWKTACIESVVGNWRDSTLYSEGYRENAYKSKGKVAVYMEGVLLYSSFWRR